MKKLRLFTAVAALSVIIYFLYELSFDFRYRSFAIIHTNDIHGNISQVKVKKYFRGDSIGGMSILAALAARVRIPKLLFDSGDIFQGTPEGDLTDGQSVIKLMNMLGYLASTVGNHEFDRGLKKFVKMTQKADFPFIVSNITDRRGKIPEWLSAYEVFEPIPGFRLGVLGVVSKDFKYFTLPGAYDSININDEIPAASSAVSKLKARNVNMIFALTHIGFKGDEPEGVVTDVTLLRSVPEIDFILAGHVHAPLEKGYFDRESGRYIYRTGGNLKQAGVLRIYIDKNGKEVRRKYKQFTLSEKRFGKDKIVEEEAKRYSDKVAPEMDRIIGKSEAHLGRRFDSESALGNYITDVMREKTKSDIAFHNSGGIRTDLKKGEISYRDLYMTSPFGNTLFTMKLDGKTIRAIAEHSLNNRFGVLQESGLKIKYAVSGDKKKAVKEIYAGDKLIVPDKMYKVVTNNFVAEGGDSFGEFKRGKERRDTGINLLDALLEDIRKKGAIKSRPEGRMSE